ncbi:MAG: C39 family peptidase, partial [candidate division WOR-3 bacterium]
MLLILILLSIQNSNNYFVHPILLGDNIILTNNAHSAIYLIANNNLTKIISAPGCGYKFSISPDRQKIGLKVITGNGKQYPALLDLTSRKLVALTEPVTSAGQVSFSDNSDIAYTLNTDLFINKNGDISCYPLGTYANLAPISPDGKYVCYNDNNDRLFLLDLKSRVKISITDSAIGHFNPVWSPDSRKVAFSTLNGFIKVYDIEQRKTYLIGEGKEPHWSYDGEYLVYHKDTTNGHELTGSDLYLSNYSGTESIRLTETPDEFEMDPCFVRTNEIVYHNYTGCSILKARIGKNRLLSIEKLYSAKVPPDIDYYSVNTTTASFDSLDIPYIHQVYDTPDWFNGHWACGPTTAMMAIIYYRRLPIWSCQCSYPYPHTSNWGRYICERYFYREVNYNLQAQDPNGNWAMGGYGYMWNGSNSPYSTMYRYYQNHNISSQRDDSPTLNEAVAELNAGYPYSLCNGLTSAGHLILCVGYAGNGIIISNDPYGNKNRPGYPNYYGRYARYDWPGYNNGYHSLNYVYWSTTTRGSWPARTDTLVDDLAIEDGFYLHTASPSTMAYWWDQLTGFNGHIWYTYTTGAQDTCYATWTPRLSRSGNYEVLAFIPGSNATTTNAQYRIYYNGGNRTIPVNQATHPNQWVSLGTYPFALTGGYVRLGDATGTPGQRIAFDAVNFRFRTEVTEKIGESIGRDKIFLNKSLTRGELNFTIHLVKNSHLRIAIFGPSGRSLLRKDMKLNAGEHKVKIETGDLSSGVYFADFS